MSSNTPTLEQSGAIEQFERQIVDGPDDIRVQASSAARLFILAEVKKSLSPRDRESLRSLGINKRQVESFAFALFLHWRNGLISLAMLPDGLGVKLPGSDAEEEAARSVRRIRQSVDH
jgi:hypothetical protein